MPAPAVAKETSSATPNDDGSSNISGRIVIEVLEGSRLRSPASLSCVGTSAPEVYVKIRNPEGEKARTRATKAVAPIWTSDHGNRLELPISNCLEDDVSVEVWTESNLQPNQCLDTLEIPVEAYARSLQQAVPKWHALDQSGALLFAVTFTPSPGASTAALEKLEKLSLAAQQRRRLSWEDKTLKNASLKYHSATDPVETLCFGHRFHWQALGGQYLKYGTCLQTYFQKSKKCLQLQSKKHASDEGSPVEALIVRGNHKDGTVLKYGERFQLMTSKTQQKVQVGTGWFQVQPVGKSKAVGDPVAYGDAMYLEAIYAKTGAQLLGAEGESHHVLDKTVYISPHVARVTFTLTYEDGLVKAPSAPPASDLSVKITTYNVWMMPDKITAFADVSPQKNERAQLIPAALPESDIVVFNEAFCHTARPILLEAMKELGYIYEVPVVGHLVGELQAKFLDSGVVLVSKYPIVRTDGLRFGSVCKGDDALADKGCVYAHVVKDGRSVHVFASHTQAWTTEAAVIVRQDQFQMMRHFMDEQAIPADEPVFCVGDFNVNKLLNDENHEYDQMLEILECDAAKEDPKGQLSSFDAEKNPLAADGPSSDGVCERLDFILTCQHHRTPLTAKVLVEPIKSTLPWTWDSKGDFHDLSDHYPVTSEFSFNYSKDESP